MKIKAKILAVRIPFEIPLAEGRSLSRQVYAYALLASRICLVDAGVAGSERLVFRRIREEGGDPRSISRLVLTHAHPDHLGGARAVREASGCEVAAHENDKKWIEDVHEQAAQRPVPGFHSLVGGSVGVDRVLRDGDLLETGAGESLRVIHTPGHSPGSVSLFLASRGALFCGDALPQPEGIPVYDDVMDSVESIKKLKSLPGIETLYSSWDEPLEGPRIYERMEKGLARILRIHETVREAAEEMEDPHPLDLCRWVGERLGWPATAANPLTARSLAAHWKLREAHPDLAWK